MLNVLLADDEPVIAKGIARLIDWSRFGAQVAGMAYDGTEAMQMLETLRPDILVTDICMPGFDGVALLRHVHNAGLPTRVIFVSGFQEFRHAQDAVRYGAVGYLLKPVDPVALEEAIEKAVEQIEGANRRRTLENLVDGYERDARSSRKERYLNDLVQGRGAPIRLTEGLEPLSADAALHAVMLIMPEETDGGRDLEDPEASLRWFAVDNLVEEIADARIRNLRFRKDGRVCLILCGDEGAEPPGFTESTETEAFSSMARQLAADLCDAARSRLHLSLIVAVGETVQGMRWIHSSHDGAAEALAACVFFGTRGVLAVDRLRASTAKGDELGRAQRELADAFGTFDSDRVRMAADRLLDVLPDLSLWNRSAAVSLCMTTLATLVEELAKVGIETASGSEREDALLAALRVQPDYAALRNWMTVRLSGMLSAAVDRAKGRDTAWLRKVKAYIEEHYGEGVALETAAGVACMNPTYFSSLFKKQTGENFKEYLTRVRMEHAVRILMTTDLRVYEISERVGFGDYRHFSEVFRKRFGKTPNDYRAEHLSSTVPPPEAEKTKT